MAEVKVSALTALTGANVANGDELYIVDTGSPNVSKKITADELAQMPQLSSRYVSKAEEEYRWIGYSEMVGVLGAAYAAQANESEGNAGGFALDSSQLEAVKYSTILPDYWATYKVDVYWMNQASSSGDVRIKMSAEHGGNGDNPDGGNAIFETQTVAAPTTVGILAVTSFPSASVATNVAGKPVFGQFIRFGADAADTLANDMLVCGVLFRRVS